MNTHELSKADMLDILFENRNKSYGAYTLRRQYNGRLWTALFAGLGLAGALLWLATGASAGENKRVAMRNDHDSVVLRTVVIPAKPKPVVIPVQKPAKPALPPKPSVARVKYTNVIHIVDDKKVKTDIIPSQKQLDSVAIAGVTAPGFKPGTLPSTPGLPAGTGLGTGNQGETGPANFVAVERDPQFPGGAEALRRFLSMNLNSPTSLDEGEKKVVQIRFQVDPNGMVSTFQIVTSGGDEFDKEVVRVCRKMPRWIPALQNGVNVPVSYMLPVTFIGGEQ
ncbi:MAG: TonB family protein [Chitinophagaceae bacterium]|nr:TonB family protein [Chitinophagaceae bacterium]